MDDARLRGQLRINSSSLDSDLHFIRNRFADLSEPKPVKTYGTGEIRFWQVDFAATRAQWRAASQELETRGILATLYEEPHQAGLERLREETRLSSITHHGRSDLLVLIGALIVFASVLAFALTDSYLVWVGIAVLGLFVIAIARAARHTRDEREREAGRDRTLPRG